MGRPPSVEINSSISKLWPAYNVNAAPPQAPTKGLFQQTQAFTLVDPCQPEEGGSECNRDFASTIFHSPSSMSVIEMFRQSFHRQVAYAARALIEALLLRWPLGVSNINFVLLVSGGHEVLFGTRGHSSET